MNEITHFDDYHTTPPVLLWQNGERTAWGRAVVFHDQEPERRPRGEEARPNHISHPTLTGETTCNQNHA